MGGNNSMLPICISFTQYTSIMNSTIELLLNNSSVLLLLWEECTEDFRSVSDVAGVAKSLLICGLKKMVLF